MMIIKTLLSLSSLTIHPLGETSAPWVMDK